jgi:hypothetical protein
VISINNPFSITTTFQNDTIQDSIHFANLDFLRFDHIPTEYFLDSSNTNLSPNILTTSSLYHGRTIKSLLDIQYWNDGNCWSGAIVDPGPPYYDYIEGCGGPYYSSMPWILGNYSKNVLVYYKKGNEIWGTPLASDCNALGVDDFLANDIDVSVFPNPASNKLNFRIDKFPSKNEIKIEIFDFTGKSLIDISSNSNQIEIGTETLPSGLYFYSLSIDEKFIKSDKILIVR